MIANLIEVLPGAVGKVACVGLALLFVGGCTIVLIQHEPLYGVILGVVVLIGIAPGVLRETADRMEARLPPPPRLPRERDPNADRPAD